MGGGSSIILNVISDIEGAKLYSLDYLETISWKDNRETGFAVEANFPHLMDKWQIYRGVDVSRYIEAVGGDIDLLVLDTAHVHP